MKNIATKEMFKEHRENVAKKVKRYKEGEDSPYSSMKGDYESPLLNMFISNYYAHDTPIQVLCDETGITRTIVYNILTGASTNPTIQTVERLLSYYVDLKSMLDVKQKP